jgi:hypothetical protein
MKVWCGKCGKCTKLFVSFGPVSYVRDEFWGQVALVPEPREIELVSQCCAYTAYANKELTEQVDPDRIDLGEYYHEQGEDRI